MKITFHIGAHATDGDRLMRSLMRNADQLAAAGIFVPGPSRFRTVLREVVTRLKGAVAHPDTLELVLDNILDTTEAEHVVLSYDAFMCGAGMIMAEGGYYARAGRTAWLRNVFPGHEVRFALGLRNPATHVPAVFATVRDRDFPAFMQGVEPLDLLWSRPVQAIAEANPGCPLVVWCNEDTPMIWPDVMRAVADHPQAMRLQGGLDIVATIMQPEGLERLRGYLSSHPPASEVQRRRILSAFLDKYSIPGEIEQEIDLPGWTGALVDAITERYEEDIVLVRDLPGVTFIPP